MNQDLFFDGRSFISVSRASKETGYTQDYLGQLCRASKVPARMVGRTWYIDKEIIFSFKKVKKNNQLQEKKNPEIITETIVSPIVSQIEVSEPEPQKIKYVSAFKFESETAPLLPELKKNSFLKVQQRETTLESIVPYASIAFIFIFTLISWLQIGSPRVAENLGKALSAVSQDVNGGRLYRSLTSEISTLTELSAADLSQVNQVPEVNANGLVVFPNPENHDQAVATVKNSFSDEATVTYDKDGTSGVITPVFRKGSKADDYAFVMVPIKQQ